MFYIEKNDSNSYVFYLKSDTQHIIASSKPYSTISKVEEDIKYIVKNTKLDRIYERKTTKSGEFYFNILDASLDTSAKSQLYTSKVGLENGIKAAKDYAKQNIIKKEF